MTRYWEPPTALNVFGSRSASRGIELLDLERRTLVPGGGVMPFASRLFAISLVALACARDVRSTDESAAAGDSSAESTPAPTDRIGIAMNAAPSAIAAQARIIDFDAAGNMIELRAGTNGWMCLADDSPAAPGESPACMDERWQQWFDAYTRREIPRISGVGMAYMLQGSLSPSNTDPFAETPPAGADWIEDGPHVMVIVPDPAMLDAFPGDHRTGGPYVMYKGTPYAHLMVPVSRQ